MMGMQKLIKWKRKLDTFTKMIGTCYKFTSGRPMGSGGILSRLFEKTNVRTLNHSPRVILSLLFSPSTLDIGMV